MEKHGLYHLTLESMDWHTCLWIDTHVYGLTHMSMDWHTCLWIDTHVCFLLLLDYLSNTKRASVAYHTWRTTITKGKCQHKNIQTCAFMYTTFSHNEDECITV